MADPGETTECTPWQHLLNTASHANRELRKTIRVRDTIGKEGSGKSFKKELVDWGIRLMVFKGTNLS